MNILYISMIGIDLNNNGIYSDLIRCLIEHGHSVTLIDDQKEYDIERYGDGMTVLPMGMSVFAIDNQYLKGIASVLSETVIKWKIKKELKRKKYDLMIYATPPIMFTKIIKFCKNRFTCKTFLMLKDIFPQNAVDEGLISKTGPIYRHFRRKEKLLYSLSDYIGCMSQGNIDYLIQNNAQIERSKICLFPNSIFIDNLPNIQKKCRFREKFGIPRDKVLFVFGGNLGIAQGIPFLIDVISFSQSNEKAYFLIVGSGTQSAMVEAKASQQDNLIFIDRLSTSEYDELLDECDVGIVSLGGMYTIPNYPSRMLSYMKAGIPMLAITDGITDVRNLLESEAQCGLWSLSGDIKVASANVEWFCNNEISRKEMGRKALQYCREHFNVEQNVKVLEQFFA